MPRAVLYAEGEGYRWQLLPEHVHITSIEARGWRDENPNQVAALVFDDGSTWDPIRGFVEATEPPLWEQAGLPLPAWLDKVRRVCDELYAGPHRPASGLTIPDWDVI